MEHVERGLVLACLHSKKDAHAHFYSYGIENICWVFHLDLMFNRRSQDLPLVVEEALTLSNNHDERRRPIGAYPPPT